MDIRNLLRKLANGYHFGFPECCVVQHIEDEIYRNSGAAESPSRKHKSLFFRKEMGLDYLPCDSCIEEWVGKESLNVIADQLKIAYLLATRRNIKPLPLSINVDELLQDRWKMINILQAINYVILSLKTAPAEDVDEIYAEVTRLFTQPKQTKPIAETSAERKTRLERLKYQYQVWPLEISWTEVDGARSLDFVRTKDEIASESDYDLE